MELDLALILLFILTGLAAGVIDAIAGGGGMITLPVLLISGMSPVEALATNKLQGSFGTFAASLYFVRKKLVDLTQMKLMIICTFAGAVTGTVIVQQLDTSLLASVMPLLLVLIALYFMLSKQIGDTEKARKISDALFAFVFTAAIGFYDGFFGPGTGTFFALGFVSLLGFSMARATAHTKILNFTSNIAALIFFAIGGNILWLAGFIMAAGQLVGGQIGAQLVVSHGVKLIRPLVVVVTLTMSAKLLFDQYQNSSGMLFGPWLNLFN
ncbi:TSUP family transporter [Amphritea sp. 2_MG-2023]|uniref:TSUP family transporter n=1 Tax=Amphritea TaxID=515417 RepID=UPI001C0661E2|nr:MULTISPECIES: TSUP family transporter [Amphritea]MBU2967636.1 TSUP family transporter [Amphritea atlantica]MDO6420574.1 TSUP family transporter [Amphritea sp. 2_MG-2023]